MPTKPAKRLETFPNPNPAAAHDKDFLVLLVVVFIGAAGDYWGVDGWRSGRR